MRKLNTKNKIYIWSLSIATLIVIILLIIFIISKIKILTFKYNVSPNSYTYDENRELLVINDNYTLKKTMLDKYYILDNDKNKTFLYDNPVIYNKDKGTVTLFGVFYEVLKDGDVKKLKNYNEIVPTDTLRVFKITDRRYLVIAKNIKDDKEFSAVNYLLIDLDTAGNAYLFNDVYNIKTFETLKFVSDDIVFDVNREEVTFGSDVVDLSKISGSTNNYKDIVKNSTDNSNTSGGGAVISNVIDTDTDSKINSNIYQNEESTATTTQVTIAPKTTILDTNASATKININYLIFDPYNEYTEVYFVLTADGFASQNYVLNKQDSSFDISSLVPNTKYHLEFYYSYLDNEEKKVVNFDSKDVSTTNMEGKISLEKVDGNIVQYKVMIDKYSYDKSLDNYCNINVYLNNEIKETKSNVSFTKLMGDDNLFSSELSITKGSVVKIVLDGCKYNGNNVNINAQYKFKI